MRQPKTVNFLGIPFTVIDEEEQRNVPEGSLYMMIRVEDADPDAGSPDLKRRRVKTICDQCTTPCWLDPKSYLNMPAHVPRLCTQCVLARAKAEAEADE